MGKIWGFCGILVILYGISWWFCMGFHGDFFHGISWGFCMGFNGDFFMGFHGDFVWDLMVIFSWDFHGVNCFMKREWWFPPEWRFHQYSGFMVVLLWINMVFLWDFNWFHQHFWYRGVSESGDFSKHPENLHFSENDDQPVDGTGYDIFRATFDIL